MRPREFAYSSLFVQTLGPQEESHRRKLSLVVVLFDFSFSFFFFVVSWYWFDARAEQASERCFGKGKAGTPSSWADNKLIKYFLRTQDPEWEEER